MGFLRRHLAWISLLVTVYGAFLPIIMWWHEGESASVLLYSVPLVACLVVVLALAIRRPKPLVDPEASAMLAAVVEPDERSWPVCCGRHMTDACGHAVCVLAAKDLREALARLRSRVQAARSTIKIEKVCNLHILEEHVARLQHLNLIYHAALSVASRYCVHLGEGRGVLDSLQRVFCSVEKKALRQAVWRRRELRGKLSEEFKDRLAAEARCSLAQWPQVLHQVLEGMSGAATLDQVRSILAKYVGQVGNPEVLEGIAKEAEDWAVRGVLNDHVVPALEEALAQFPAMESTAQDVASRLKGNWHDDVHQTWRDRACKPYPLPPPARAPVPSVAGS